MRAAPAVLRHDGPDRWKACALEGLGSSKVSSPQRSITRVLGAELTLNAAQTFAVCTGMYAAVSCVVQRLRQRDDSECTASCHMSSALSHPVSTQHRCCADWNSVAGSVASGLAIGWSGEFHAHGELLYTLHQVAEKSACRWPESSLDQCSPDWRPQPVHGRSREHSCRGRQLPQGAQAHFIRSPVSSSMLAAWLLFTWPWLQFSMAHQLKLQPAAETAPVTTEHVCTASQ